jgi:hypothetical protein
VWRAAKPGREFLLILLEQHEAPAHEDDLALAIGVFSNDGRDVAWEDRRQWLEYDRPVVRNPEETDAPHQSPRPSQDRRFSPRPTADPR